jgi:ElaB/YqjD/DUF883 family membrane-anchored ribosome-binding protein
MSETEHDTTNTGAAGEARTPEEIRADIEQTREQLGDTVEALAEKTDVKARAQEEIESAKANVAETISGARDTVSQKAGEFAGRAREATPESASAGAAQLGSTVQEKPLPFAVAGAFAAGLLIGWLLGRR